MRPATADDAVDIAAHFDVEPATILQAMDDATFYVAPGGFACWDSCRLLVLVAPDAEACYGLLEAYVDDRLMQSAGDCTAYFDADNVAWLADLPVSLTPIGFTPIAPDASEDDRVPMQYAVSADAVSLKAALANL